MTPQTFPKARADALVAQLDVDLNAPICYACLSIVSFALEEGTPPQITGATIRVTQDMWHEGLAEVALRAVRRARDQGVPDADAALVDLEERAGRSAIARAVVRRLAAELLRHTRAEMRLRALARDRLRLAPPELN